MKWGVSSQLVYKCYQFSVNFRCWICSWTCQPDELEEHQHPGNDKLVRITSDTYRDVGCFFLQVSSWTPFRHCSSGCSALCFRGLKLHPQYLVACHNIYTVLRSPGTPHPQLSLIIAVPDPWNHISGISSCHYSSTKDTTAAFWISFFFEPHTHK